MKTVTGRIISAEPIPLSKAAKLLSDFASADNNEASQDVSAYLQRAAAAFTELKSIHREIKSSTKPRSDIRRDRNPIGESDCRAKEIDDLVENGEKIRDHDEIKEDKKAKKKKSKKKKEEDVVVDEKVKEKLEEEEKSEERKEKKKKKSKKNKEEDVVDEKVNEKLEEEEKSEEGKEKKKKKRKSDGEIGSEEKKSKKRRKSKEKDG